MSFHHLVLRTIATIAMLGGLYLVLTQGDGTLIVTTYVIEGLVFQELIQVSIFNESEGCSTSKKTMLDWTLFGICSVWIGAISLSLSSHYPLLSTKDSQHHEFLWLPTVQLICMMAYTLWFVAYILWLDSRWLPSQLVHFTWLHIVLLFTIVQSYFIAQNIQNGLVWFLLPVSLVVCNDIFAFLCGRLFGKHRLLSLSPNKTLEGFIGAGILTIVFGYYFATWLLQFDALFLQINNHVDIISLEAHTAHIRKHFGWHGIILAFYASLAAPFGGFFASAVKRAASTKDYSNLIPGHGGMTDRMDCQLLMGIFTFVYYQCVVHP